MRPHTGRWVRIREAAQKTGLPEKRIRRWAEDGEVPSRKDPSDRWEVQLPFPADVLARYASNSRVISRQNQGGEAVGKEEIYVAIIRVGGMTAKLTHFNVEQLSITVEQLDRERSAAFDDGPDSGSPDANSSTEAHHR